MKWGIKNYPLAIAMVIPGCHSGKVNRGGDGGVCPQRIDDGGCLNMRGCSGNGLFQQFRSSDIILANDENMCKKLVPAD
jgi:hypothetical protein